MPSAKNPPATVRVDTLGTQDSDPTHTTASVGSVRNAYIYAGNVAQRFLRDVGRPTAYRISIDGVHLCTLDADQAITIGKAAKAMPALMADKYSAEPPQQWKLSPSGGI
jgi:hypothetical protein